jgi:hypothetical protein
MDFDYRKLTTVVLATVAAYVAYRQYQLGREKFKLDLFEKRFAVFAGTPSPLPVGTERTQLCHEIHENLGWLVDQLPELKKRFSPYMKFKT